MDLKANCIAFAEVPQAKYKNEQYLRKFRKQQTKMNNACGISANIEQTYILPAEVPQMPYKQA